jgi:UDP-glucose 4-epimerase
LLEHPLIQRVIGLDVQPPPPPQDPKLRFITADIRDEYLLRTVMEEEGVDTVLHLAFQNADGVDHVMARETNVHGTLVVLEAADKCPQVQKLIIAGSTAAYGARRDNPQPLAETARLRASGLAYAVHKRRIEEELTKALPQIRRSLQISVLRLATIVGPAERARGPVKRFCELPFGASVILRPGGIQFISEDDAVAAFCKALEAKELRGAFNIAPDDHVTIAEICDSLGKGRLALPYCLLWLALFLGRRLFGAEVPEGVVAYLAHPLVASGKKFQDATGFTCADGSLAALLKCTQSLRAPAPDPAGPA